MRQLACLADEGREETQALGLGTDALALLREIRDAEGIARSLLQLGQAHGRAGRSGAARETLGEAVDLLRQQQRRPELARALALMANLPGGDVTAAEAALREAGEAGNTPEVRYDLWKATHKPEHLAEAKRLLDYRVEHASEEYRESMLENVRLNREIMEAWAEHGEQAPP